MARIGIIYFGINLYIVRSYSEVFYAKPGVMGSLDLEMSHLSNISTRY